MMILAIVFAVTIGFLLKGKIRNLENVDIKALYLILVAFSIELVVFKGIAKGSIEPNKLTFLSVVVMYIILFYFIYKNRHNKCCIFMGVGVFLNALVILINGGVMPVDMKYVELYNMSDISKEGLYTAVTDSTILPFLGDVIPFNFIAQVIVSIGDIFIAVAIMMIIITGMKSSSNKKTASN